MPTTSAVRGPAATFTSVAPASIWRRTTPSASQAVTVTGTPTRETSASMVSTGMDAFTTTEATPHISECSAASTQRSPWVMEPPTPLNTGRWDAATRALVIAGWQVNGYTASTASASQWQITAKSVENTSERILRPATAMPGACRMASGTASMTSCSRAPLPAISIDFTMASP